MGIRTRILRLEGDHADHLPPTDALLVVCLMQTVI